jgi:hypothetical protein
LPARFDALRPLFGMFAEAPRITTRDVPSVVLRLRSRNRAEKPATGAPARALVDKARKEEAPT